MTEKIEIEIITDIQCRAKTDPSSCCEGEPCADSECNCQCACYSTATEAGKNRAKELGATQFPAVAINGTLLTCPTLNKALASLSCC